MRKVKITKIKDILKGIEQDFKKKNLEFSTGMEYTHPYLGGSYNLYKIGKEEYEKGIETSQVVEIIDDSTFKTKDALYKIEELPII